MPSCTVDGRLLATTVATGMRGRQMLSEQGDRLRRVTSHLSLEFVPNERGRECVAKAWHTDSSVSPWRRALQLRGHRSWHTIRTAPHVRI